MGLIEKTVIFLCPAIQTDLKTKMLCSRSSVEVTRQKKDQNTQLNFSRGESTSLVRLSVKNGPG